MSGPPLFVPLVVVSARGNCDVPDDAGRGRRAPRAGSRSHTRRSSTSCRRPMRCWRKHPRCHGDVHRTRLVERSSTEVFDDTGATISTEGSVSGTTVSIGLPDELEDGTYVVAWRVISADSHPISGITVFSVGARRPMAPPMSTSVPRSGRGQRLAGLGDGRDVRGSPGRSGALVAGSSLVPPRRGRRT